MNKRLFILTAFASLISLGIASMLPSGHTYGIVNDPLTQILEATKLLLASLIFVPALIAGVVGILEYLGVLSRDAGDKAQLWSNYVLYLACFFAVLFGKTDIVILIERYAQGLAPIIAAILAMLTGGVYSSIATQRMLNGFRTIAPVRNKYYSGLE